MRCFYPGWGLVVNGRLPQNSIQLKQALPCFQKTLACRHHWKKGLKISNITKFERDLLKTKRHSISKSERCLRVTPITVRVPFSITQYFRSL